MGKHCVVLQFQTENTLDMINNFIQEALRNKKERQNQTKSSDNLGKQQNPVMYFNYVILFFKEYFFNIRNEEHKGRNEIYTQ